MTSHCDAQVLGGTWLSCSQEQPECELCRHCVYDLGVRLGSEKCKKPMNSLKAHSCLLKLFKDFPSIIFSVFFLWAYLNIWHLQHPFVMHKKNLLLLILVMMSVNSIWWPTHFILRQTTNNLYSFIFSIPFTTLQISVMSS